MEGYQTPNTSNEAQSVRQTTGSGSFYDASWRKFHSYIAP